MRHRRGVLHRSRIGVTERRNGLLRCLGYLGYLGYRGYLGYLGYLRHLGYLGYLWHLRYLGYFGHRSQWFDRSGSLPTNPRFVPGCGVSGREVRHVLLRFCMRGTTCLRGPRVPCAPAVMY